MSYKQQVPEISDNVRQVGGITIDGVRYAIQTRGWSYGETAIIQHVELTKDGIVLISMPNTEAGRTHLCSELRYCPIDPTWLSALINEVR